MAAKPVPDGYRTVTPYLTVKGAARALEFYQKAFDAEVTLRLTMPGDQIAHAEIRIGDSMIMLSDEWPDMGKLSPVTRGGATGGIALYVDDADAWFKRAIEAGATVSQPLKDQFYGDRTGSVTDPFGHFWTLATHKEDLSEAEMQERMDAMMGPQG